MRPAAAGGALLASVLLAAAGGCGGGGYGSSGGSSGSSGSSSSGGVRTANGPTIALTADPGGKLSFDATEVDRDKAGRVTVELHNPSNTVHAIAVSGPGATKRGPAATTHGGTSSISFDARAGTYEIYCPIDGHRAAGMTAKLVVAGQDSGGSGSGGSGSSGPGY
jgi:uncharacterized cupredoxin-like copper-binding protein